VDIKGFGHEPAFRAQSIRQDVDQDKRSGQLGLSKRIVTASDDPSGAGIMARMEARAASYGHGQDNASAGLGLARMAGGAMDSVSRNLERMRELATGASNGTLSDGDRKIMDAEFQELKSQVKQTFEAEFGDVKIFGGDSASFGVGDGAGDTVEVQLPDSSDTALANVDSLAVDTSAGSSEAMAGIDQAKDAIAASQAELGAAAGALSSAAKVAATSKVHASASASRIGDADIARQSAVHAKTSILKHAVLSMQAHQGLDEQLVGKLLE
jgi:flagellin